MTNFFLIICTNRRGFGYKNKLFVEKVISDKSTDSTLSTISNEILNNKDFVKNDKNCKEDFSDLKFSEEFPSIDELSSQLDVIEDPYDCDYTVNKRFVEEMPQVDYIGDEDVIRVVEFARNRRINNQIYHSFENIRINRVSNGSGSSRLLEIFTRFIRPRNVTQESSGGVNPTVQNENQTTSNYTNSSNFQENTNLTHSNLNQGTSGIPGDNSPFIPDSGIISRNLPNFNFSIFSNV